MEGTAPEFVVEQLGRMAYADALEVQRARHAALVEGRAAGVPHQVLVVEHPAVITVTRRVGAAGHVLAD
jgi:lipoate-protein ligase B